MNETRSVCPREVRGLRGSNRDGVPKTGTTKETTEEEEEVRFAVEEPLREGLV